MLICARFRARYLVRCNACTELFYQAVGMRILNGDVRRVWNSHRKSNSKLSASYVSRQPRDTELRRSRSGHINLCWGGFVGRRPFKRKCVLESRTELSYADVFWIYFKDYVVPAPRKEAWRSFCNKYNLQGHSSFYTVVNVRRITEQVHFHTLADVSRSCWLRRAGVRARSVSRNGGRLSYKAILTKKV